MKEVKKSHTLNISFFSIYVIMQGRNVNELINNSRAICGDTSISWKCKKQPTVSLSTIEAQYLALTEATK